MAVPKLRFPEFTDDWEQRKLGDLYTERNERGNGSLQILSVSIHTGVSDGELDVDNLGKFVRRSEDKSTYKHVHSGDLIFNMMRAWQGAIGVAKTEGMISPAYISAIPSEDIYPPFMNYLLRRKDVINQINNLSYGVTDFRKRLYWNSFVQVNCKLPSVEEQRNITDVFEKIDHLITLHQRKLDDIKLLKKSMLQKMFPAEGRDVPEVRFPGFTAAWEQRKLFEMATFSKGSGYSKADLAPSGTPIILYGRMYTKYETIIKEVDTFAEEKAGSVYSKGGEVIVPASGETAEDISRASVVENTGVLLGGDINIIHPNDNLIPGFLALTISNGNQQKKLSAKAQGASIVHLHNEDLKDVDILYPTIAEQRKISEFFQGLDDTITLHQRKCGDLKELKRVAFNGISLKSPGRRRIWHNGIL
jgi:type I restriction enzyme S subunit